MGEWHANFENWLIKKLNISFSSSKFDVYIEVLEFLSTLVYKYLKAAGVLLILVILK